MQEAVTKLKCKALRPSMFLFSFGYLHVRILLFASSLASSFSLSLCCLCSGVWPPHSSWVYILWFQVSVEFSVLPFWPTSKFWGRNEISLGQMPPPLIQSMKILVDNEVQATLLCWQAGQENYFQKWGNHCELGRHTKSYQLQQRRKSPWFIH